MTTKKRKARRSAPNVAGKGPVTLWLDRAMWDRFVSAVDRPWNPASASGLVRDFIAELTPQLEDLNGRIESGDRQAIAELIDRTLVDGMVALGGAASDLRSDRPRASDEEDEV